MAFIHESIPAFWSGLDLPNKCWPEEANEPVASSGFDGIEDDVRQGAVPSERFVEVTHLDGRAAPT